MLGSRPQARARASCECNVGLRWAPSTAAPRDTTFFARARHVESGILGSLHKPIVIVECWAPPQPPRPQPTRKSRPETTLQGRDRAQLSKAASGLPAIFALKPQLCPWQARHRKPGIRTKLAILAKVWAKWFFPLRIFAPAGNATFASGNAQPKLALPQPAQLARSRRAT